MKNTTKISYLEWDSDFFGFSIARFKNNSINKSDVDEIKNYCYVNKIRLLQFECDVNDRDSILVSEELGFHFADFRINYKLNIDGSFQDGELPPGFRVDFGKLADINKLREIAGDIYQYSRYYFDLNFPVDKVPEFYRNWIQKSVLGQFDDFALVLYFENNPIGFIAISLNGRHARFNLVGLSREFSRRGLGLKFVKNAISILFDKGVELISTVTQGRNIPAQNLYSQSQFFIDHNEIYYHYWLDSN